MKVRESNKIQSNFKSNAEGLYFHLLFPFLSLIITGPILSENSHFVPGSDDQTLSQDPTQRK